jgi:hypothetical protein
MLPAHANAFLSGKQRLCDQLISQHCAACRQADVADRNFWHMTAFSNRKTVRFVGNPRVSVLRRAFCSGRGLSSDHKGFVLTRQSQLSSSLYSADVPKIFI